MARIIYVEDDDLVGEMVKQTLVDAGHLVGIIGHGALAYETIVFKKPDLILLDCSLPGMNGLEILQRVRAIPDIYLMPIVMLTAFGNPASVDAAMAAGANDYIVKSANLPELVTRIAAVLTNSLYCSKVSERLLKLAQGACVPANAADAVPSLGEMRYG